MLKKWKRLKQAGAELGQAQISLASFEAVDSCQAVAKKISL